MQKKSGYKYVILIAVCLIGFLCTYGQYQLSPLAEEVMGKYGLTDMQYSMVFTAPMTPAIFLSLVYGIVIDRISGKKIGFVGLILAAVGMWGRIFAGSFIVLYICMLAVGFAAAFVNSTHPRLFDGWFSPKEASICVGIFSAMSSASMAVGTGTTALMPSMESAFILSAILITCLLVFWIIFYRDAKGQENVSDKRKKSEPVKTTLGIVLRNRSIILGGICLTRYLRVIVTISSFMPMLLQERGMSQVEAGAVAAVVPIGQIVGNLVIPVLVAKIGKVRRTLSVLSLAAVILLVLASIVNERTFISVILFLIGFCAGGCVPVIMSFGLRVKTAGVERMGTVCGLLATFQLFGAVVLPSYVVSPIASDNHGLILVIIALFSGVGVILPFLISAEVEEVR